jgi:uncharacterized protein YjbI with pentapeptide repeats
MDSLAVRWREGDGPALAGEIFLRLSRGASIDDLGLGEIDGRLDLRGVNLRGRSSTHLGMMQSAVLAGIDFSGAVLPGWRWRDCRLSDCLFRKARVEDLRIWGTTVTGCDFHGAVLAGVRLGSGTRHGRNVWKNVDFTAAKLRGSGVNQAVFDGCDFSQAQLSGVEFRQCTLLRVTFAGPLRGVMFDGREVSDAPASPPFWRVDLSRAELDMVDMWGCEFIDSRFPDDEDVIAVPEFPAAAASAVRQLAGDESTAAGDVRAFLAHALYGPEQSPDSVFLLNRRDFLKHYPGGADSAALAVRLLAPGR